MSLSSDFELRPYQQKGIADLRAAYRKGARAPIYQLATGGGKTVVFSAIGASVVAKGRKMLVLVHRRELVRQAWAKLALAGVEAGIISSTFPARPELFVQVASVQTVINRLDKLPQFDLVVIDECHHSTAPTYRTIIEHQADAKLLGVSATPIRLDGKGLDDIFDAIVSGPSIKELVDGKFLSPSRLFIASREADVKGVSTRGGDYVPGKLAKAMSRGNITGDAVEQYRLHADHKPAIAFCVLVKHAEEVAGQFREAGYRSQCVHGGTPKKERDALIAGLATGEVEVLTSCDLISEGLDVPAVGAVILLRPTKSPGLYMQQVGRGMRTAPGKDSLLVLDNVGNIRRHGPPDLERIWGLAGVEKAASDEAREGQGGAPRHWTVQPGSLTEVTPEHVEIIRNMPYLTLVNARWSEAQLRIIATIRGYQNGWVWHQLRNQNAVSLT
jgi:DNA repair protein RadD